MLDVDGVIVSAPPGGWAAEIERDLGVTRALLQEHFFAPHWEDVMLGRAALHDRLSPVLAEHAPHLTSHELAAYWFEKDAILNEPLLADLAALRTSGLPIHLATVQEHERASYLWDTLRLRDRFDALHYAADLGAAKPDPAFYAAIEAHTGLSGPDLLLLDDRAANVEAARAVGWGGALWDGTATLAQVLAAAR